MLLNCRTQGHAWQKHGVTQDKVLARNAHVADGSKALWGYAVQMIDDDGGRIAADLPPIFVKSWHRRIAILAARVDALVA